MRWRHLLRGFSVAVVLAALIVACDDGPPSAPSPGPGPGGTSNNGTLVRLELTGPNSIAPGATGQFTVRAIYSDGTTLDKSPDAMWRTSNAAVIAMSAGGVAVARDRGEASITAQFGGRSVTKSAVLVLPDGTFRIRGSVRDEGIGVNGAQVAVTEGPSTGLMTTTVLGGYALYGVASDAEITITKDGYQPIEQRFQVTGNQTLNFDLTLSGARQTIAGNYTLRLTVAAECRPSFSLDLQQRTYSAAVHQEGPRLTVMLGGATFAKPAASAPVANKFTGTAEPDRLRFFLSDGYSYYNYNYYADVIEQVSPNDLLSISGSTTLTRTPTGFSGEFDGQFVLTLPTFARKASCRSVRHGFELIGPEK